MNQKNQICSSKQKTLRARLPYQGLEKFKKSNFQLPKDPCGHDTWTKGLKKSNSKISSSQKAPAGTTPGQRVCKNQTVKFPAPKRPLRARHPEQRAHVSDVNTAHVSDLNKSDVSETSKIIVFVINRVPIGPFWPIFSQN